MRKHNAFVCTLAIAAMCGACSSHWHLADVGRTRIVVDSTYDAVDVKEAAEWLAPYKRQVDSVMSPVVGEAARYMSASKPESELPNLLCDILVWEGRRRGEHPDLAVYNMDGIRAALSKGVVTYGDVLAVAPFENKICFLTLSGKKMLELCEQIASRKGEGVSH
ncbi:MAG: 5'-nucleotidase, partial [Prevotella sp.]|nr:5'-nucleotidase [Prevotella sp.]